MVSAFATAHPIKPRKLLENCLFGFSCAGEGGVPVAREAVYGGTGHRFCRLHRG